MPSEDIDLIPIENEEEQYEDTGEEAESDGAEEEPGVADQNEPADLADAFARIAEMDAAGTADALEAEEPGDDSGPDDEGADEGGNETGENAEPADDDGYDDGGGSSDGAEEPEYPRDYQGAINQVATEITRAARQQAAKEFSDNGIRHFTMRDLYRRDDSGNVTFVNPDDRSRPFSSRMEAQQWIDSMNKEIDSEMRKRSIEISKDIQKAAAPALRLLRFAPTYDAMPDATKRMFDDLIEDYEVKNGKGQVVGYSCDLDRMAAKAERIAAKYSHTSQRAGSSGKVRKSGPLKSPALDARSHGSSAAGKRGDGEVKTMEDAFRELRRQMNGGE